eukprot:TRINITY_DN7702_c0_g1_i1.p1 TRINITY_DN7702_c0_g1~~TRINITY_DN7702_c0_g1_i1.p1  ORF type:complete len:122 (+),score=8.71 TRINITY_DN7702_c0_g1_i1:242-607(+)
MEEVAIERDYSHGMRTRFVETFPPRLQGKVTEDEFLHTITTVNKFFDKQETYTCCTCFAALLSCMTLWSTQLCLDNPYRKMERALVEFLREENERVYKPKGVEWLSPMDNGCYKISIVIHP